MQCRVLDLYIAVSDTTVCFPTEVTTTGISSVYGATSSTSRQCSDLSQCSKTFTVNVNELHDEFKTTTVAPC